MSAHQPAAAAAASTLRSIEKADCDAGGVGALTLASLLVHSHYHHGDAGAGD